MGHEQIKDILERQLWLLHDRAGSCGEHELPGLTSAMLDLANTLLLLDSQLSSTLQQEAMPKRNGGAT